MGLLDPPAYSRTVADARFVPQGGLPPIASAANSSVETIITTIESGHGFTAVNASTSNLADTADYITGTQSIQAATKGDGTTTALQVLGLPAADATDKYVKIRFKAGSLNFYNSVKLRAGNNSLASYYEWTIATTGTKSTVDVNSWQSDTLNWQKAVKVGTPSRSALTDWSLLWTDNNTGQTVTMHLDGISLVDDGAAIWPLGVCSITFDDSYNGVYNYARPAMDKYGFRGTVYPIWERMGGADRMNYNQHRALRDAEWELGTHAATVAAHDAALGFPGLTTAQLDAEFTSSKAQSYAQGFRGLDHMAWPQSFYNDATIIEARKYFASCRTTYNVNYETFPPANPMWLRSWSVHTTDTPAQVLAVVDAAIQNRSWLILDWHQIVAASPGATTDYLASDFTAIMDGLAARGMPVRTIGEVLTTRRSQGGQHATSSLGWFGDGSDGVLSFDGTTTPVAGATLSGSTYTLTRDVWATQMTVAAGVTIDTARFRIYARDALVNNGTILGNGSDAAAATGGAAKATRSSGGGLGGGAGGVGVAGGAGGGVSIGGIGGAAGAGGNSTGGGTGGGAGAGTFTNGTGNSVPRNALAAATLAPQGSATLWQGGAGGGGGNAAANSTGGGGGGGGTVVAIYARVLINSGTVAAKGGKGGDAALGTGTGAGGGGGGGGGAVVLVVNTLTGAGTFDVSGGAGGAGVGTGATGAAGSTGVVYKVRA